MAMTIDWREQLRPGVSISAMVREATAALVSMDALRLEELAQCCADLNREMQQTGPAAEAAAELKETAEDLKLLEGVLFETRANLAVFSRLHVIRLRESGLFADAPVDAATSAPHSWLLSYGIFAGGGGITLEKGVPYGDN